MGRARATNLAFEKVVSWQGIGLENYVWYGPVDAEAPPKNVVVSLQKRQNQHCFRPVVHANSFNGCEMIHDPRTVADFFHQQDPPFRRDNQRLNGTAGSQQKSTWDTGYGGKCTKTVAWALLTCGWKLACAIAWETMIFIMVALVHPDCVLVKTSTDNSPGRWRDAQPIKFLEPIYTSKVI